MTTYSLHPGGIITEIVRHVTILQYPGIKQLMDTASYHGFLVLKDLVHGAQTTICCAVDEKLKHESGKYYKYVVYIVHLSLIILHNTNLCVQFRTLKSIRGQCH